MDGQLILNPWGGDTLDTQKEKGEKIIKKSKKKWNDW